MINADRVSEFLAFVCHRKRSPLSKLVLVVGHELNLIAPHVRIDLVKFLPVVALAVNEGDEQASRLRTQHVFENARFKISLQLVPGRVLAVFQRPGIAAGCARAAAFLDLVVSGVGEAQGHLAEGFAELVFLGQQLQHASLRCRRIENKIPIADKHGSRHLARHRRDEADSAGTQMERPRIALQVKIADTHCFAAQGQVAQSLVGRIGVRPRSGILRVCEGVCEKESKRNQR